MIDLYLLSIYRRAVTILKTTEMPRSQIAFARLLLSSKRNTKESQDLLDPIFSFLIEMKCVKKVKKQEGAKKRAAFVVLGDQLDSVLNTRLDYRMNLRNEKMDLSVVEKRKRTSPHRSSDGADLDQVNDEREDMERNENRSVKSMKKKRKVSRVQQDLAVL